ncbi:MAG: hypothetical protein IT209_02255 [Armatimonadetes bacterium]|nr:hypothetical protein [Armatimonadota bacterium]
MRLSTVFRLLAKVSSALSAVLIVAFATGPLAADYGNIVVNGDFENGLTGWNLATPTKPAYNYNNPPISPQIFSGNGPVKTQTYQGTFGDPVNTIPAAYNNHSIGWFRSGPPADNYGTLPGGFLYNFVYQNIFVTPGVEYTIESANWQASAWNTYDDSKNSINEIAAMLLIRMDSQLDTPYDPNDPSTYSFRSTCWNLASLGNWVPKQLTPGSKFTSTTGRVQIQVHFQDGYYDRDYGDAYTNVMMDDLYIGLDKPLVAPPTVASIAEAKSNPDSSTFNIANDAVVTLAGQGFFYAQDPDGTAGIHVNSSATVAVGDTVKLDGVTIVTNPDGERQLNVLTATVTGTGTTKVRKTTNRTIDGNGYPDGEIPLNQGLLMKTSGRVMDSQVDQDGNPVLFIDDGSGVDGGNTLGLNGLRVIGDGTVDLFTNYIFTGVVSSVRVDGRIIRVLRLRGPSDIVRADL